MVHGLHVLGEEGEERVGVAFGDRGVETGGVRGRSIRLHAAPDGALNHPAPCFDRRVEGCLSRFAGQLVEAGDRFDDAVDIERFHMRHQAIGFEDPQAEEVPLERATAGAVGSDVGPAHQERIGSQRQNVVDAPRTVAREVEQRAVQTQEARWTARGPEAEGSVVDAIDIRREYRGHAIDIARPEHRRHRSRRCRRACALGAVGGEVGVALVQSGDGVAQPVLGEDLRPPASPLHVGLDQDDFLVFVGADIELAAGRPAC